MFFTFCSNGTNLHEAPTMCQAWPWAFTHMLPEPTVDEGAALAPVTGEDTEAQGGKGLPEIAQPVSWGGRI